MFLNSFAFKLKFDYLWQMSVHLPIKMTDLQPSNGVTQPGVWEPFKASMSKQCFLTCWKGNTIKGNSNCAIIHSESHPVPCGLEFKFASGILHFFFFSLVSHYCNHRTEVCEKYERKYCTYEWVTLIAALHLNCTSIWLNKNKAVISFMWNYSNSVASTSSSIYAFNLCVNIENLRFPRNVFSALFYSKEGIKSGWLNTCMIPFLIACNVVPQFEELWGRHCEKQMDLFLMRHPDIVYEFFLSFISPVYVSLPSMHSFYWHCLCVVASLPFCPVL